MKKALIIQGGWDGHHPATTSEIFANGLAEHGIEATTMDSLEVLADADFIAGFDLVVPLWTMGELSKELAQTLSESVRNGVGLAGTHGGMCDAFRGNIIYQWMSGGQFLGHPHVGEYEVQVTDHSHPATTGMADSFSYNSEQYYMMIDPSVQVLAETTYEWDDARVKMPVVWHKPWGKGRVFYSALGHKPEEFTQYPEVLAMTMRGFAWAAR